MSDLPSYDQDLLARLNALKKSNISLDVKPSLGISKDQEQSPETDLSARLRSLRNGGAAPASSPDSTASASQLSAATRLQRLSLTPGADIDNHILSTRPLPLLTDAGDEETMTWSTSGIHNPSKEWTIPELDGDEVKKLMVAASKAKANGRDKSNDAQGKARWKGHTSRRSSTSASESPDSDVDDSEGEEDADDSEVQEILERLADELELEALEASPEQGRQEEDIRDKSANLPEVSKKPPDLPPPTTTSDPESTASGAPSRPRTSLDFEADVTARMAALRNLSETRLTLPSAPSSAPLDSLGLPSVPSYVPSHSGTTASQPKVMEDWCVICQDDATIYCHGCADEAGTGLYCAMCWKEGHMGPDAGREERRHEWSKYRRLR